MWHRIRRQSGSRGKETVGNTEVTAQRAEKSADFLYFAVAQRRLDSQTAEIDTFDTKAAAIFTIGSAVLPVTASLLTASSHVLTDSALAKWALIAGAGFYVALVVVFVLAYRLAKWDTRPELDQWTKVTVGRYEDEICRWLGDAYIEAYQANLPQLRRKAALVGASLWLLAGEAAFLTLAVLFPLF